MVEITEADDGSPDEAPESKPDVVAATAVVGASKRVYARAFLLSVAKREACKGLPEGLDSNILKEIAGAGIPIPNPATRGRRDLESEGSHGRDGYSRSPQDAPEWRKDSWRAGTSAGAGQPPLLGQHRRRGTDDEGAGGTFATSYPPRPGGGWESNGPRDNHDRHNDRPFRPGYGHGPPGQQGFHHGPHGPPNHGRWDSRPNVADRDRDRDRDRGFRGHRSMEEDESGDKGRSELSARRPPTNSNMPSTTTSSSSTSSQVSLRPGWSNQDHADSSSASKTKAPPRDGVASSPPSQGDRYLGPQRAGRAVAPYQPARPKEDEPSNQESFFGDGSGVKNDRTAEERKRREVFEQMRAARHRQMTDQKLKNQDSAGKKRHDIDSLWDPDSFSAEDAPPVSRAEKAPASTTVPVPNSDPASASVSDSAVPTPATPSLRPNVPPGFVKPGTAAPAPPASALPTSMRNGQTSLGVPPGFRSNGAESSRNAAVKEEAVSTKTSGAASADAAEPDPTTKTEGSAVDVAKTGFATEPQPGSSQARPSSTTKPSFTRGHARVDSKDSEANESSKAGNEPSAAVLQKPGSEVAASASTTAGNASLQAGEKSAAESEVPASGQSAPADPPDAKTRAAESSPTEDKKANETLPGGKVGEPDGSLALPLVPASGPIVGQNGEQGKEPTQQGEGKSLLNILFQQAGADLAVRSGPGPSQATQPPKENLASLENQSSKFARWFSTPDGAVWPGASPGPPPSSNEKDVATPVVGGLAEALKTNHATSENTPTRVLPMPRGPSLEDIEKGFTSSGSQGQVAPPQVNPPLDGPLRNFFGLGPGRLVPPDRGTNGLLGGLVGSQTKGPPKFMTLEDIEQSILAEAGSPSQPAGQETESVPRTSSEAGNVTLPSEQSNLVFQPSPPQPRDSASQHLLFLLKKGPSGASSGNGANAGLGPSADPFSTNRQPVPHPGQGGLSMMVAASGKQPDQVPVLGRFGSPSRAPSSVSPQPIGRPSPGPIGPIGPASRSAKAEIRPRSEDEMRGSALGGVPWLSPLLGFQSQPQSQAPGSSKDPAGGPGSFSSASGSIRPGFQVGSPQGGGGGVRSARGGSLDEGGADSSGSVGDSRVPKMTEGKEDGVPEGSEKGPSKVEQGHGPVPGGSEAIVGDADSRPEKVPAVTNLADDADRGWNPLSGSLGLLARPNDDVPGPRGGGELTSRHLSGNGMPGGGKGPAMKPVGPPQKADGVPGPPAPASQQGAGADQGNPTAPMRTQAPNTQADPTLALGTGPNNCNQFLAALGQPSSGASGAGPDMGGLQAKLRSQELSQQGLAPGPPGVEQLSQMQAPPAVARGWTPFGMPGSGGSAAHSQFMEDLLARGRPTLGNSANEAQRSGDPSQQHQQQQHQQKASGAPIGQNSSLPPFLGVPQTPHSQQQQQAPTMLPFQGPQPTQQPYPPMMPQQQQLQQPRGPTSQQLAAFHRNSTIQGLPPGTPLHESSRGGGPLPYVYPPHPYLSHQAQVTDVSGSYQPLTGQAETNPNFLGGAPPPRGLPPGMQQQGRYFGSMPPFMQDLAPDVGVMQPGQHMGYGGRYPPAGMMGGPQQGMYQGGLSAMPSGAVRQMHGGDLAYGGELRVMKGREAGPGQGLDRWFGTGAEFSRQAFAMPEKAPPQMMGLEELERQLRLG